MAKDPAILFYTSDFLTGSAFMNYDQRGKYITLLCLQHQHGHLSEHQLSTITGNDPIILEKFEKAEDGKFHNLRLHKEVLRRKEFCDSRRKARQIGIEKQKQRKLDIRQRHVERMETETENKDKDKKERKRIVKEKENKGVTNLVAYYCDCFKARYGDNPIITAKDAGILKRLSKLPDIETLLNRFFASTEAFIVNNAHSVSILSSQINKLKVQTHGRHSEIASWSAPED